MVYKEKMVQCFRSRETRQRSPSSPWYRMNDHIVNQRAQTGQSFWPEHGGSGGWEFGTGICKSTLSGCS